MATTLTGAPCAPYDCSAAKQPSRNGKTPPARKPRRFWLSAQREPTLDNRLLQDIGVSHADLAAFLL